MKTLLLSVLVVCACARPTASVSPVAAPPVCSLPVSDRAWIDRALEAWRFTSREIMGIGSVPDFRAVFFSADCAFTSENAFSSPTIEEITWVASRHTGEVLLPDGKRIPAGVTSYVSGDKSSYFLLVMSTPTVWQSAGVGQGPGLETMMVGVMLHEGSHVAQTGPYGPRLGALIERHSLPDSFNDDSLQAAFKENPEFAASIKRETEIFLESAAAKDVAEAKRLAREGLRLVRQRQAKWLIGDKAYFVEAEDIWLTFEGAGQWAAYQWLTHPRGGGMQSDEVMSRFTRGRWWSQTEGFAVVMALDRLAGPEWKRHAFGDGARTVLEMLEDAAEE